jgi:hypothetical protein
MHAGHAVVFAFFAGAVLACLWMLAFAVKR